MTVTIRRAEPGDFAAVHQIYLCSNVIAGTLQLPFSSVETWRKRLEPVEGVFQLLACTEQEVVGHLGLHTFPNSPRRRHVGAVGMAVRDDWQGKGVGSALLQAAVDLADQWLNLSRLELEVFVDNAPAIHLYQKYGFVVEGTAVDFAFRAGQYVNIFRMARLRQ